MDIVENVKVVYLILALIGMGLGVRTDIRERKFPNGILVDTILLGILFGLYSGHLMESIIGFLLLNILGIFFHRYHLISAGDMKFLSVIFLFINILDVNTCLMYLVFICVCAGIQFYYFYRKTNRSLIQEFKKGLFSVKALALFKINTFSELKFENKKEMLDKTVPLTLPMYLAFVLTVISRTIFTFV